MSSQIDISIIIPAYNESKRLPKFLQQVIAYCQKDTKKYEIIVVDDGSSDATFSIAESYKKSFADLRVIKNIRNSGKGHSVKTGLFSAIGDIRVFLDADGSTQPDEIARNTHYFDEGYDIVVGSRVLRNAPQVVKTRWHRRFMGKIFNYFIRVFLFTDIKDTQCGFKMFKKEVVKPLFSRIYLRGFGFDIELLYLAFKMGYKVIEKPVTWHHVTGSKINILMDSLKMLINIFQVRNWHCTPINRYSEYLGPDEYKYMYLLR